MIHFKDEPIVVDLLDDPSVPARESFDEVALGNLADSMAADGLLQPIGARGPSPSGRYEVVWGHCRTIAARRLGWATIDARVCVWSTDPLVARTAENQIRVNLNPREEARQCAEFRERGYSLAATARVQRKSVTWVESRLALLDWPADLQEAVARGELALGVARELAGIDHELYRGELVREATRTGATVATVQVWTAHYAVDRERIIRNAETVDVIMGRRETFIMLYQCDACREQRDTRQSVMLRICPDCLAQLRETQREEDRERALARAAPPAGAS